MCFSCFIFLLTIILSSQQASRDRDVNACRSAGDHNSKIKQNSSSSFSRYSTQPLPRQRLLDHSHLPWRRGEHGYPPTLTKYPIQVETILLLDHNSKKLILPLKVQHTAFATAMARTFSYHGVGGAWRPTHPDKIPYPSLRQTPRAITDFKKTSHTTIRHPDFFLTYIPHYITCSLRHGRGRSDGLHTACSRQSKRSRRRTQLTITFCLTGGAGGLLPYFGSRGVNFSTLIQGCLPEEILGVKSKAQDPVYDYGRMCEGSDLISGGTTWLLHHDSSPCCRPDLTVFDQ